MSGHHSFTAEGSLSSVTTSRAQSFEAGDPNEGAPEGQPLAKGPPADKKGHSRSRSWVAAAIAPFSRSASGLLKPSEEVSVSHPAATLSLVLLLILLVRYHST